MEAFLALLMLLPASAIDAPVTADSPACGGEPDLAIHADAVVQREILGDVDGDGEREVITGYRRAASGEAYLHVRFASGWSTGLRLDHLDLVLHPAPMPEGMTVMGDGPVIVVSAGGIAVGARYIFVAFQDCALVALALDSGEFPELWFGGGLHHSEWFTCRADGVVHVQAFREDADSDVHETAVVTLYERDGSRFRPGVELGLVLPMTLDQIRGMFPPCPLPGTFLDDDRSGFEPDIEWLAARGFAHGCNPPAYDRYCPNDPVTRGQMAAVVSRALRLPATRADHFSDDGDSVFEGDIDRVAAAGITRGCNPPANDRYCPNASLTRGEVAAFLSRALGLTDSGDSDAFTDDAVSIFEADINRVAAAGITRGCNPPANDRYCPDEFVTRAQIAALLHRARG